MTSKEKDKKVKGFYKLAYEAYKMDWMHRISADRQIDSLLNYWDENLEDGMQGYESYEAYLNDTGYDSELYVCFDEFLGAEFLDRDYMSALLRFNDNPNLEVLYKEALKGEIQPDEDVALGSKYLLVSSCDRNMCGEGLFDSLDDAKETMCQGMLMYKGVSREDLYNPNGIPKQDAYGDGFSMTDEGAYVKDNYDSAWQILKIPC